MVDTPDLNKAIDVALEEYKTLRAEIIQGLLIRTNVVIFGGAVVATLIGIGITPLANLPTTTKTIAITGKSSTQTISSGEIITESTMKSDINEPNKPKLNKNENTKTITRPSTTEIITPFGTEAVTTTIQPMNEDSLIDRRLPSAIILGIVVPISCGCIIYLIFNATKNTLFIGRYIATNIEPKINFLYLKNLPHSSKPLTWENYMQTINFGLIESQWILFFFGGTGMLGMLAALFIGWKVANYWAIQVIILIIIIIYYLYFFKQIKELPNIRDKEGSKNRIYYTGFDQNNTETEIKPNWITWKYIYQDISKSTISTMIAKKMLLFCKCKETNKQSESINNLTNKHFYKLLNYINEPKLAKKADENLKMENWFRRILLFYDRNRDQKIKLSQLNKFTKESENLLSQREQIDVLLF